MRLRILRSSVLRNTKLASATTAGLLVLSAGSTARADATTSTPAATSTFDDVGNIYSAVSSLTGFVGSIQPALQFLNLLQSSDTQVLNDLNAIKAQLGAINVAVQADAKLNSQFWVQNLLANSKTGVEQLQENFTSFGTLAAANSPVGVSAANSTLLAVNQILPASGDVDTESNAYFEAIYAASNTDGPVSTTVGVKTTAEWKLVMPWRPAVKAGLVFDWREGLPALTTAIAMRLGALGLTASPSSPNNNILNVEAHGSTGAGYDAETRNYESVLSTRMDELDSQIHCRESIWAVGQTVGDYDYKWLCTDVSSGISGRSEKRGTIAYPPNDRDWNCGADVCYNFHWQGIGPIGWYTYGTTRMVNASASHDPPVYDSMLIDAFRKYAPKTPAFATILAHGKEDALNALYKSLGVFHVQQVEDQAENAWEGIWQPAVNNQIKNWGSQLCLDLDPTWVGAEILATGKSQMIAGYPFILNDCKSPTDFWTSDWGWDSLTGEIVNSAYLYLTGAKWCIATPSSRTNTAVVTAKCDGSDGQVWTWDSGTGMFKNKLATMSPLTASSASKGATIAVGPATLSQGSDGSTQWGG